MQAVKGRNTSLEKKLASALFLQGLRFRRNLSSLPGKPDIVFSRAKVAVFVDGDFWHGWRYPLWKHKLTEYWRNKIERNRRRDRYNFQRLRRRGWTVVRIWGHDVERDLATAVDRVKTILDASKTQDGVEAERTCDATHPAQRRRGRGRCR